MLEGHCDVVAGLLIIVQSGGILSIHRGGELGGVFFPFTFGTFGDGLLFEAIADALLHLLKNLTRAGLRIFIGAGEHGTQPLNFVVSEEYVSAGHTFRMRLGLPGVQIC